MSCVAAALIVVLQPVLDAPLGILDRGISADGRYGVRLGRYKVREGFLVTKGIFAKMAKCAGLSYQLSARAFP